MISPQTNQPASKRSDSGFRWSRIATIAAREFRQTVFTKGFIFGAVLFPLVMFAVIGVMPFLLSSSPVPVSGTLVVADEDGSVARAMQTKLDQYKNGKSADPTKAIQDAMADGQAGDMNSLQSLADLPGSVDVIVRRVALDSDLASVREELQRGELLALIEIPAALLTKSPPAETDIVLLVPTTSPAKTTALFSRAAREATVIARVERTGMDLAQARALVREPKADTARLTKEGTQAKERTEMRFLIPGGFMLLMWIATFTSANQLLTTTIEEKSSKVIEVLLSAVSPLELLSGKIVGQSLVSLLMLLTYGGVGIAGLAFMTMLDIVPLSTLVLFLVWFLLAYFMVASIMAAVGSAVSDLREAQSLVAPAMGVIMIPLMLWLPITQDPTGRLATIMSFIPPAGPFVMVLRTTAAVEPIGNWQIAIALIVNAGTTIALVWIASRIFRVGVLMQGKPPTPRELLRWARTR